VPPAKALTHLPVFVDPSHGTGKRQHVPAMTYASLASGADGVLPYRRLFRDVERDDLVLLHFSMGNEVFTQLAKLRALKVLVYHNITPAEFFRGVNPHAATHARLGRRQLGELAAAMQLGIGVSEYNQRELDAGPRTTSRRTTRSWPASTACGRCSCSSAACRRTSARTISSGCWRITAHASIRTRGSCSWAASAISRSTTRA